MKFSLKRYAILMVLARIEKKTNFKRIQKEKRPFINAKTKLKLLSLKQTVKKFLYFNN